MTKEQEIVKPTDQAKEPQTAPQRSFGGKRPMRSSGGRRSHTSNKVADEFEQKIVDLARVTRVMAGGKRMKFRACMIVGDKNGRVGVGLAKGIDVSMAIAKSVTKAKKHLIHVPIIGGTIPHDVKVKYGSARLIIKPAKVGSGIKAGGVVRIVLELAGVRDVVAKILGTNNKVNNAEATILALSSFMPSALRHAKNAKAKATMIRGEKKLATTTKTA